MVPPLLTIQTLRENIKKELHGLYPDREINSIIDILCRYRLDLKRHEAGMRKHEILMPPDGEWFRKAVLLLREKTPIQYITGETEFFELHLRVGPQALIPRPETEELVKWILDDHSGERCRILDIGTGTGCIALALAKNLSKAEVHATDVQKGAIELAMENAHMLEMNINFIQHDILKDNQVEGLPCMNIIVSNPPYIPSGEKETLDANVRDYEPSAALFVPDDDPLVFYRHIAQFCNQNLCPGGMLYLEIHEDFGLQVTELLEKSNFVDIQLRKDINEKDRMIRAVQGETATIRMKKTDLKVTDEL